MILNKFSICLWMNQLKLLHTTAIFTVWALILYCKFRTRFAVNLLIRLNLSWCLNFIDLWKESSKLSLLNCSSTYRNTWWTHISQSYQWTKSRNSWVRSCIKHHSWTWLFINRREILNHHIPTCLFYFVDWFIKCLVALKVLL